jgi:hypothetical protein
MLQRDKKCTLNSRHQLHQPLLSQRGPSLDLVPAHRECLELVNGDRIRSGWVGFGRGGLGSEGKSWVGTGGGVLGQVKFG